MTVANTFITIVFYVIFLGQIFILSLYYPRAFVRRMTEVYTKYPPAQYPRFYPDNFDLKTADKARLALKYFWVLNMVIALIGASILIVGIVSGYSPKGHGEETIVAMYFMLQVIPHMLIELSAFKRFKLMRESYSASTRKADLHPRRLSDFISPVFIIAAITLNVIWLYLFLVKEGFDVPWRWEVFVTLGSVALAHLLFVGTIIWHMRGRKIDPYQAHKDKLKQIEVVIKAAVFGSIAMSSFFLLDEGLKQNDLAHLQPALWSLYFQIVAVFGIGLAYRKLKIENTDFDVYKGNDAAI